MPITYTELLVGKGGRAEYSRDKPRAISRGYMEMLSFMQPLFCNNPQNGEFVI